MMRVVDLYLINQRCSMRVRIRLNKLIKILAAVIATVIVCCVSGIFGCLYGENRIEDYLWKFDCVQLKDDDGEVVACSAESIWREEGVDIIELSITVGDGTFVIINVETQDIYSFEYDEMSSSVDSTIYSIKCNDAEGIASVGKTYYADGEEVETLIITFSDYNLYFYEK